MPSLCRTKHNRAKPMSELPSAMFLIADGSEFRFARFYIVCEEVPLGTPESPPIVSGVSDMHPADCQNVEETRNLMQTFSWKKCSHFSPTNIPSAFPHEITKCVSYNITYHPKETWAYCDNSFWYSMKQKSSITPECQLTMQRHHISISENEYQYQKRKGVWKI